MKRRSSALPALTLLSYLLLSEPPALLLLFFGALAFHEWGHLIAFRLVGAKRPTLRLTGVGMRMSAALPLLPNEEAVVALAGPIFNILFALFALRFGRGEFFLLAAAIHLLFGVGNLLPFGGCDGERLLRLLLLRLCPRFADTLLSFFGILFLSLFFYLSLFSYYLTGGGLCGVFFSLYFLFGEKKSLLSPNELSAFPTAVR